MANPKRKTSKAKQRRRRAQWMRSAGVSLVPCPQCRRLILPHTVCKYCGFYKDKKVIRTRSEIKESKRKK